MNQVITESECRGYLDNDRKRRIRVNMSENSAKQTCQTETSTTKLMGNEAEVNVTLL